MTGKKLRKSGAEGLRLMFRSFGYRNYRLFFGGQSLSLIGTWIQRIATPWLVYHLTNDAFLLGVVGFAGQIPTFLIAPFAGVLTDRWNKYRLLVATQVLAMIQALVLAILFFSGSITVWMIVILSIFLGIVNAFDVPARQSFVIELVGKKEDIGNAIALNSSMVNGARLIGPSIAGMVIAFAGEGVCFLANGISYVFVITSLLLMKVTPHKRRSKKIKVISELQEGFRYAYGFPPIRYIILLLALISLVGMPYTVLMPVIAKDVLHGGAHTFGFLMGASGFGALMGAFFLASKKDAYGLERLIPLAAVVFGLGLVLFSFSRSFSLSMGLMIFIGLGMMLQMALSNTILQTVVEDDKRGRVMSFYTMAFMGTAPFGSIIAGSLAKSIGAPYTMMAGGILCIVGALLYSRKQAEIKSLIAPLFAKSGAVPVVSEEPLTKPLK